MNHAEPNELSLGAFKEKIQEIACAAQAFGTAYAESIIEAAEYLERSQEVQEMERILRQIMGLESEKETIIIPLEKDRRRNWREAAQHTCEREYARAYAFCMAMKQYKAREVARNKHRKRMRGGLT